MTRSGERLPRVSDLTALQAYQHRLSTLLDQAAEGLNGREQQAFLTYTVQRATIVLAPPTAEQRRGQ